MSSLFRKFTWWAQRRRKEEELREELQFHLEEETQERQADGLAEDQARRAAHRDLGNVTLVREDARTLWIPAWWDHLLQDTRYGIRLCGRTPGFAVVVVLTLALGIGLNTAVFSVVNAVLVRPLAYSNPERLVWVARVNDSGQEDVVLSPDFVAWRDQATVFDGLAGYLTTIEPIDVGDDTVEAHVAAVTDGFWSLTGARFALGGPPSLGQPSLPR